MSPSSVCETPSRNQHSFGYVLSVLACVLDCTCRDKPSWRGQSCVTGDNQRSSGVVIARIRSLGALDHQRRDLHPMKLSYLMEHWALSSINDLRRGTEQMTYWPITWLVDHWELARPTPRSACGFLRWVSIFTWLV